MNLGVSQAKSAKNGRNSEPSAGPAERRLTAAIGTVGWLTRGEKTRNAHNATELPVAIQALSHFPVTLGSARRWCLTHDTDTAGPVSPIRFAELGAGHSRQE